MRKVFGFILERAGIINVLQDPVDSIVRDELSHNAMGAQRAVALRLMELQEEYKHLDLVQELEPCFHPDFYGVYKK